VNIEDLINIHIKPELEGSTLIVGWHDDGGKLGPTVTSYLIDKLGAEELAEIEPSEFFPLNGVSVDNNIARLSECSFHYCPGKNIVILRSDTPRSQWHLFLNTILHVAEKHCRTSEIYVIGSMVFLGAHNLPRDIIALSSSPLMKTIMGQYNLAGDINYESPSGQRPSLNSVLLWSAQKRDIPSASLWVPIPFYLVPVEDPRACRTLIEFFNTRLHLGLNLEDLDSAIYRQDEDIIQLRGDVSEVDNYIRKLESNEGLTQEESEQLAEEIQAFFSSKS